MSYMQLQNKEKNLAKILGDTGEKIAANYFLNEGRQVQLVEDFYSAYDLIVDGLRYQVKVTSPFLKYDSWVFKGESQIKSIFSSQKLLLLTIPMIKPHKTDGSIVEIDVKDLSESMINFKLLDKPALFINRNSVYYNILRYLHRSELDLLKKHTFGKMKAI